MQPREAAAFRSPLRGQTPAHDRFGASEKRDGCVAGRVDLPERPGIRVNRHTFEQQKAAENALSLLRQEGAVGGVSRAAGKQFAQQLEQARAQQAEDEDRRIKAKHPMPLWQTSKANPLLTEAQAELLQEEEAQQEEQQDGAGGSDADSEQAPAGDAAAPEEPGAAAVAAPAPVSPARAPHLQDHLEVGSLAPTAGCEGGSSKQPGEALAKQAEADAAKLKAAEEALEALMAQWPHGLPKKLLRELRESGVLGPALGHGFLSSTAEKLAICLRPLD